MQCKPKGSPAVNIHGNHHTFESKTWQVRFNCKASTKNSLRFFTHSAMVRLVLTTQLDPPPLALIGEFE
jgi:hypothetical protein